MAVAIDQGVVSRVHRYTEVDKESVNPVRNPQIPRSSFMPVFRPADMLPAYKALNLRSVVSTESADWFSPQAGCIGKPFAEVLILREAKRLGNVKLTEFSWLSRLALPGTMIRKNGSERSYAVIGHCSGNLCWGWPLAVSEAQAGNFVLHVPPKSRPVPLIILEPKDWVARPFEIRAPMHTAIRRTKVV